MPAWEFILTRQRTTAANLPELNVSEGDLEITVSVILRGIGGAMGPATSVAWMAGAAPDNVFELMGDYNGDGAVDAADYVAWANGVPSADGDDDGEVEGEDLVIQQANLGNTLTLLDV